MKTPMQEHIEWLDIQWGNAKDCGEKTIDFEIAMKHAEQMLEKEKEVIVTAYQQADTESFRYDSGEHYYNETFKTKEK